MNHQNTKLMPSNTIVKQNKSPKVSDKFNPKEFEKF